jgi:hypothetical protein
MAAQIGPLDRTRPRRPRPPRLLRQTVDAHRPAGKVSAEVAKKAMLQSADFDSRLVWALQNAA